MERVIILSAIGYSFPDKKDETKRVKGTSFHYTYNLGINKPNNSRVGIDIFNGSLIGVDFETIFAEGVPAVYDLEVRKVPNKEGKPIDKVTNIEFVEHIELPF